MFDVTGNLIALINGDEPIIPISSYFSCLSCLLNEDSMLRPYLGLNYVTLENFSNPETLEIAGEGALIYPDENNISIVDGSPAEKAGLKEGDIIITLNAIKIDNDYRLSDMISQFRPGEKINMTIIREGVEMQVLAILESLPLID